ncbi:MAG: carboxymuconolactone decarboxylase family protein [Candidatus Bipolaricaulia bacterium]
MTSAQQPEVKLEDLIPIAVVIAAGCEPCARLMVERALEQGSSERQIQKVLAIVAYLQKLDCLAESVGSETLARMEKPLAMARRTLEREPANLG